MNEHLQKHNNVKLLVLKRCISIMTDLRLSLDLLQDSLATFGPLLVVEGADTDSHPHRDHLVSHGGRFGEETKQKLDEMCGRFLKNSKS